VASDDAAAHATAAVTADVLANDGDPDSDTLTVTAVGSAAHGTASISGGNVIYTPSGGVTSGTDAFSYTISDGHGGTATATVSVYLANHAPVATDVSVAHATTAVTAYVLDNVTDADYDALTVTAVGTPSHGTASISGGAVVVYTPTGGTTASTDAFTYT